MASGTHDLTMADGTAFYIRPCLEPGTPFTRQFLKDQIRAAVGCMSEQTRWHRFISVAPALSEPHLDHLTDIDGDQRVAWCAGAFVADQHRGIGLARYVRLADQPAVAEFALTVIDEFQGRRVGTRLFERLMASAGQKGIAILRGYILPDNARMLAICKRHDAELGRDGTFVRADVPVPAGR